MKEEIIPEQALWLAVLEMAIRDAFHDTSGTAKYGPALRTYQRQAREWLEARGSYFRKICDLAGIEPQYLIRRIEEIKTAPPKTNKHLSRHRKYHAC